MAPPNLDISQMQYVNGKYFNFYANGGYGKLPLVSEDTRTTDQMVARRVEYPSQKMKDYYDPKNSSAFYLNNENRRLTQAQSFASLQERGIKLVGEEKYGAYNVYASTPDPSGNLSFYSSSSSNEMGVLLWVIIGIGAFILITNVLTPY